MPALRTFAWALAAVAVLAAAGGSRVAPSQDSGAAVTPRVKQIYQMDCAFCHGDNGNGKTDAATSMSLTMLDYTDPKSLAGKSDQELFDIIRKGKDKMPPEEASRAKDAEVRGLVAYVRGMSKGQAAVTPPGK